MVSIIKLHAAKSVSSRAVTLGVSGLISLSFLSGCADDDMQKSVPKTTDAETLYNYGVDSLHAGKYRLASAEFESLQQNFPYSGYTGNAELLEGYSYYLLGEYALSVQQLERYLQLHPTSPDAAYAYYLRALCYYERIGIVSRDQLGTLEAMDALQEVITRFPQSSYARDAQLKIDLCRDHLAGKEMLVGRFYEREKDYQAALGRYQRVVQDFQTTNHVPEALERIVEVSLRLGLVDEARQNAAILGYNYPDSKWYRFAYNKLKNHHLLTKKTRKPGVKSTQKQKNLAAASQKAVSTKTDDIAAVTIPPIGSQHAQIPVKNTAHQAQQVSTLPPSSKQMPDEKNNGGFFSFLDPVGDFFSDMWNKIF
ncbi:outer membrane protein assembly factor BamD [Aristophania vespae]|uniref:outer membrane protein assembly factor BamD n=1 Tax=Aristophania vespae TaxID=2697033 RepID=UPI0038CFEC33|nr:Outer membrane protein assembly factor BamD [Aristophania vespae]